MSSMNSPMTMAHSDVQISRSRLLIQNTHLTSLSAGFLYPIYCAEVIPGDTCKMDLSFLTRMNTPIHPTMGDAYQDIAFFFVPNRIVWNDFKAFMGESPEDPYINPIEYKIPVLRGTHQLEGGEGQVTLPFHSVLDYIGLPAGNNFYEFNALPIRGFCAIWNEWWRDQNLQYSIDYPKDSIDRDLENAGVARPGSATDSNLGWSSNALAYWNGTDDDFYITSTAYGGVLPPVSKFHDLFTSATLQAQKGEPVPIPVTSFNSDWLPVMTRSQFVHDLDSFQNSPELAWSSKEGTYDAEQGERFYYPSGALGVSSGDTYIGNTGFNNYYDVQPMNLWAKTSTNEASSYATINDLRYAFALQKYLELDNFGTRYREIIYNHFKVLSPDASMQVPEFLGGRTIRIGMQQVVQNSSTNDVSPQGNLAAYSMTGDKLNSFFTKSFTEHGFIIGVTCVRSVPMYEQNAPKFFLYREKLDLFSPEFGQIGDQPIRVPELWNDEANEETGALPTYFDEYFGFSEAWYQYRTAINHISGQMRSNHPDSLSYWHYGEYFQTQPYLNDAFIRQKRAPIGKTLAGGDKFGQDQFIMDIKFKPTWVRPVPMFSSGWYGGRL